MQPETTPKPNNDFESRQKRIEEFLLDPEKVIFQSIEEFKVAAEEVLSILRGVDLTAIEKLQGEDGKTPVRGEDYFTEEDLQGIEEFIISKIPKVGQELPSTQQVITYIQEEVAKIPRVKGEDGKSFTFSDLTEAQKEELRGEDGSPDTAVDIVKKLRTLRKTNQGLQIADVRGLQNTLQSLIDTVDEIPELRKALQDFKIVIPASAVSSEGGSGLTTEQIQDLVAAMFTGATHSGCSVTYDDTAGTIAITVSGGGGGGLTEEEVEDVVNGLLVAGTGITLTYNDVANTLTLALSGESFTTAMKTKLDHISVTQAVDLDAIETNANNVPGIKTKTDNITVTQAVNLDTIESDLAGVKTKTDNITVTQAVDLDAMEVKTNHITVTQAVDLDAIETRVNALDAAVVLKGTWDASAGTFPGGGTAQAGESWIVSVGGTVNGVVFTVNDRIIAIVDNASTATFAANWFKADYTDLVTSVDSTTGAIDLSAIIAAKATKATPVDADSIVIIDSAASNVLKRVTWANIKTTLASTFAALAGSITQAFAVLTLDIGHATDTTLSRLSAGVLGLEGVAIPTVSSTSTLTNKRITKRVGTTASSSTPTPDADANDQYNVTALAANATFGAPTGTPTDGQRLIIRVKDNGTARTLAFNAIYRAIGITLPTTTVISKTIYLGCIYNSADTKWDVIAYALEA